MKVIEVTLAEVGGHCDRPMMDCYRGRFRYVLSCGHILNNDDKLRWVNGELVHPKTIKCPVCLR